jgi:tripartite-type tricarboxylate transporter receptor subunit TctC
MIAGRRFPMHAGLASPPAACGSSERGSVSCPRRPLRKRTVGHAIRSMLGLLMLALLLPAAPADAQNYPSKPIRMIVPYPAGGVADVSARIVAQKLGESLGQQVVIENRAGASGTLGANAVAKAAPDGYTLLLSPGDFVTMPSLLPPMTFDPDKDLVPITMVSRNPLLLVANTGAAFGNVRELLAAAKASPGNIAYSTPGNGTINHLAGEWFAIEGGVKFLHVPYRGGVASANGVAAGDVPFGVVSPSSGAALVDAGKVKVIALTGAERPSFAPADWPTLAESGLPVDVVLWNGLFAPAGTPPAIVNKLDQEVGRILRDEGVRKLLNAAGIEASAVSQAAFVELIHNEAARYTRIIEKTGIRVER